jgi:hypothetical protein
MADLLMVLLMVAFVALCVAYVGWCDRIIGPDPVRTPDDATTDGGSDAASDVVEVAA